MRWMITQVSLIGLMCVVLLSGCGRSQNTQQNQTQNSDSPEPSVVANSTAGAKPSVLARVVPPGMGGDFSFACPEDGEATLTIAGDSEMSVFLMSHKWAEASQKINSIPGLKDALDRNDDQAVNKLIDDHIGNDSPTHKTYFFDGDVNVRFDLPKGRSQRSFRLMEGRYLLSVSNKGDKPTKIEVAFLLAQ